MNDVPLDAIPVLQLRFPPVFSATATGLKPSSTAPTLPPGSDGWVTLGGVPGQEGEREVRYEISDLSFSPQLPGSAAGDSGHVVATGAAGRGRRFAGDRQGREPGVEQLDSRAVPARVSALGGTAPDDPRSLRSDLSARRAGHVGAVDIQRALHDLGERHHAPARRSVPGTVIERLAAERRGVAGSSGHASRQRAEHEAARARSELSAPDRSADAGARDGVHGRGARSRARDPGRRRHRQGTGAAVSVHPVRARTARRRACRRRSSRPRRSFSRAPAIASGSSSSPATSRGPVV